tara:strand:+ start:1349 stop:1741 length:393 start_codon:yes stop_codon:yes gene_type:complete
LCGWHITCNNLGQVVDLVLSLDINRKPVQYKDNIMNILKKTVIILVSILSISTIATSAANEINIPKILSQSLASQAQQVDATLALELQQSISLQLEKLDTKERHFLLNSLKGKIAIVGQVMSQKINVSEG